MQRKVAYSREFKISDPDEDDTKKEFQSTYYNLVYSQQRTALIKKVETKI